MIALNKCCSSKILRFYSKEPRHHKFDISIKRTEKLKVPSGRYNKGWVGNETQTRVVPCGLRLVGPIFGPETCGIFVLMVLFLNPVRLQSVKEKYCSLSFFFEDIFIFI